MRKNLSRKPIRIEINKAGGVAMSTRELVTYIVCGCEDIPDLSIQMMMERVLWQATSDVIRERILMSVWREMNLILYRI